MYKRQVYTSEDGKKVEKMIQNASVTEHEGASLEINQDEKRLTVRGVNYAYNDDLLVFSDGRQIDPLEITPEDEAVSYTHLDYVCIVSKNFLDDCLFSAA